MPPTGIGMNPAFQHWLTLPLLSLRGESEEDGVTNSVYDGDDHISPEDELFPEETSPFSIRGHYKNLLTYFATDSFLRNAGDIPAHKSLIALLTRVRLSPEVRLNPNIILYCDMDNEFTVSNYADSQTFDNGWLPPNYNDMYDASAENHVAGDLFHRLNLHRLYAKLVSGNFTVTAGRQQIRFGSGRLWNPLDILNPVSPTFVEGAEDQKGTDALKIEYYPGEFTEIALVYAPRRVDNEFGFAAFANENTNILSRIRTTLGDNDLAVLVGRVARRNLVGGDIAAIVRDGMLRGSLLYASPDDGADYILGSAGYEYNFANGLYCLAEYFYNENAMNHRGAMSEAYAERMTLGMNEENYAMLANQFLTLNRHYVGLALGYDISPLLRGDFFGIADIEGRGFFLSPTVKYNLLQNLDISLTAMFGWVSEGADHASDFEAFEEHPLISAVVQWYF